MFVVRVQFILTLSNVKYISYPHLSIFRGHDFRPDYKNLSRLRQEYPQVPIMALTATADRKVVNDSVRALGMKNHFYYRSSFNRPNLHYEVRKKDNKTIDIIAEYVA